MIRLGLCCLFVNEPIKFRTVTAKTLMNSVREQQLQKLSSISLHNVNALRKALSYCAFNGIGDFRVQSGMFPLRTHPVIGYSLDELPEVESIYQQYKVCFDFCKKHGIRTSFHPDQFVVLSSIHSGVVESSIRELMHHAEVSELIGADVINIHCGGVYGDKKSALIRLRDKIEQLPYKLREKLTLENDDKNYPPEDVIPVCNDLSIPFVYDVHHHRCLERNIDIAKSTEKALQTWNREPLFHISSPRGGWESSNPCPHADYIDYQDFPDEWKSLDITVEIEAKAKELAVRKICCDLVEDEVEVYSISDSQS